LPVTSDLPLETLEQAARPAHTALLVIDVQRDLCGPDCKRMLPRLGAMLDAARAAGAYVVYVQNSVHPSGLTLSPSEIARRRLLGLPVSVTVDGTEGQEFVAEIAPHPGDPVVRKHRMNSFVGTDLDMLLKCRGIKTLVVAGVSTHGCIIHTSYAAVSNDYYVVVLQDCVASRASAAHEAALSAMRSSVHYVVDSQRVQAIWSVP
jgi:ureidoacrylate peracid hydrolase